MAQYFFNKISQAEKNDILDQHKSLYDGYVTEYEKGSNMQPLYVQDFANDKNGITVSNKGDVKYYTNTNINEDLDRRDRIGDGPTDLKHGTVDLSASLEDADFMHDIYPSPSEEEMMEDFYEYDIDEIDDFTSEPLDEFDEDENLMESVQKSLNMFKRFKNYN
jgi:hypothetical protein